MGRAEPLSDLHRHLDGSLRPETLHELARRDRKEVPRPLAFSPGIGLDEALARFAFTLSLLQRPERVRRVAAEMCEDAAAEGVTTLEVRFAPQLHRGASTAEVVDAALEGLDGRAGLILCGLYGEPPEVLEQLVDVASSRPGVVGIDLAGGPLPEHDFGMVDYRPAFRRAGELCLGRTVHAGEGRPPAEIRVAVEELGAERIGHGVTLLDDPRVVGLVVERGVVIEVCLTSNVHVGAIARVEDHPLPRWMDAGVRACLAVDNTLFSGVTIGQEVAAAARIPGMSPARVSQVVATGHEAAFARR